MNEYEWAASLAERMALPMRGNRSAWAVYSPCERYRYALGRHWGEPLFASGVMPVFSVTGLNPSTATEIVLDPTLRKVAHYAEQEGCSGFLMTNLFGWRSTDPDALHEVKDPGGIANGTFLAQAKAFPVVRVAAWGAFSMKGASRVKQLAMPGLAAVMREPDLRVLSKTLTKEGEPRHPLYLPNHTRAVPLSEASAV